jgi:DNA polymerase-3 subunit alpha
MSRTPKNFVGLHAHDGFSTFDGLDYPQEHIDFVIENGMNALAITNHGHMNSFAHAYLHAQKVNKSGTPFKFIPGCEMYVHPDLRAWQAQYDLARATKKGEEADIARLKDILKELGAISTSEGDVTVSDTDDAGLTVENEEETKSGKFYDPVKRRHHLVVLPTTSVGLQRLFHLVSRGYKEGFYRFPRVDYGMIKEAAEGGHIILSTACLGGPLSYEVFRHFQDKEFDDLVPELLDNPESMAKVMASVESGYNQLVASVGQDNLYLELQFNRLNAQHLVNRALICFAKKKGLEHMLIVTCDSHYSRPSHWKERELYKKLGWLGHKNFEPSQLPQSIDELKCELYPKNAEQVWDSYRSTTVDYTWYDDDVVCNAIERTHHIAFDLIEDIHPNTDMKLPSYTIPKGKDANTALIDACKAGLIKKELHRDRVYVNQLKHELKVIFDKEFAEYFITTKAIIDLAKKHMFVGPGRGSGAGSLVNYVLGITDVDPLKYGLLFSRFMDPNRSDYPDIDTDIGDRDKLLHLMRDKFGKDNIVPISNYNRFQLKSLVKDISRFYGLDFSYVNKALGPLERDIKQGLRNDGIELNGPVQPTFEWAMKYSPSFQELIDDHPEIAEPIGVLFKQNKALGRHAGGVIVSENIAERMPLIMAKGEFQTPWVEGASYKHLEHFGWVKFDLLGLETLRIIERTIELILKRKKGYKDVTFGQIKYWFDHNMGNDVIDWDDQEVYKVYEQGRWAGIFQCTNNGAQRLFQRAKPKSILDIAALTSIYRPGPLAMSIDKKYVKAKNNPEDIRYDHPILEEILSETYGMLVFQEQTMAIVNRLGQIPLDECNSIRKMMKPQQSSAEATKKAKALKSRIVDGFMSSGLDPYQADKLYANIMKFTAYSFNKSHAVAYAMDSYYCAWLMTYFEEEWLCAYLESMEKNADKRNKAFSEVKALGYEIVPIDINYATDSWAILDGKKFMPSFSSCKGIGDAAIQEIIKLRKKQKGKVFTTIESIMFDKDMKWQLSKFNKKAMEALVNIKAFESMNIVGSTRRFMNYNHMKEALIPGWAKWKKQLKSDPKRGYNDMLASIEENSGIAAFTRKEIIQNEMNHLGSVSIETLIPPRYINRFNEEDWSPVDEFDNPNKPYWFIVVQAMKKKTKTGKNYLRLKIMGANGKQYWCNCWGWNGIDIIDPYTVCVGYLSENHFGKSTKWSKMEIFLG